jgi:predicted  nucleic acid-binding Zn-ribbon protein
MDATLGPVNDGPDMRSRYEHALAEVEEMKRALREHARNVAAREKELGDLRLELAGRQGRRRPSAPDPARQSDLERAIAEAEKRERDAVQELALAKAERERLDDCTSDLVPHQLVTHLRAVAVNYGEAPSVTRQIDDRRETLPCVLELIGDC